MEYTIINSLARQIHSALAAKPRLTCGVLGGDFGSVCSLYYYSRVDPAYGNIADALIDNIVRDLQSGHRIPTYCNGLAGFGIGLTALEKSGFTEGASEAIAEFDIPLRKAAMTYMSIRNIDFLHGLTGLGFYLVKRYQSDQSNRNILCMIVNYLYSIAEFGLDKNGHTTVKWILREKEAYKRINISLSHGMSSIAILLCRILKLHLAENIDAKVRELLEGIKNYILSQRIDPDIYGSVFPTFPLELSDRISGSRLAWCYGDLGIGIGLFNIATSTDDTGLMEFATDMLAHEAEHRRDLRLNSIHDGELCHGAAGVAQIFRSLYSRTDDTRLRDASEYWRMALLSRLSGYRNGQPTFLSYDTEHREYLFETSILNGIAGILLFLLKEDIFLNEILLLD